MFVINELFLLHEGIITKHGNFWFSLDAISRYENAKHKHQIQHWSCLLEWVVILWWNNIDHLIVKQYFLIYYQAQWTAIRHSAHGRGTSAAVLHAQPPKTPGVHISCSMLCWSSWRAGFSPWALEVSTFLRQSANSCLAQRPIQVSPRQLLLHTLLFVMGGFQLPDPQRHGSWSWTLASNFTLQLRNIYVCKTGRTQTSPDMGNRQRPLEGREDKSKPDRPPTHAKRLKCLWSHLLSHIVLFHVG